MTSLLERPVSRRLADAAGSRLQLAARGALAAVSVLAVTGAVLLVLVLIVWAADARSAASAGAAARVALSLVLLAARVPIHVAGGTAAIPPLTLTAVMGLVLARSTGTLLSWWSVGGAIDLRDDPDPAPAAASAGPTLRQAGVDIAAVAVPFAVLLTVLALAVGDPALRPAPVLAAGCGLVFATGFAALGACRRGGAAALLPRLPEPVAAGIAGGLRAAAVLVTGAAICLIGALGWHSDLVSHLARRADGGVVGDIALGFACLLLLPNAVLAAVGYLVGAGFSLGVGTSVTAGAVHLGTLPPLPLLAAVPHGPAPLPVRAVTWAVLAVTAATAALLPRGRTPGLRDAFVRAGVASATCALLIGVGVTLAGGPAGPRGLATVGASGWLTGLLLFGEVFVGAMLAIGAKSSWEAFQDVRAALKED